MPTRGYTAHHVSPYDAETIAFGPPRPHVYGPSAMKLNAAKWASAARKHGDVMWNQCLLPMLTPSVMAATPHRALVEHTLSASYDPTGGILGLPCFTYDQVEGACPGRGLKALPRNDVLSPPSQMISATTKEDKLVAYRTYRVRVVLAVRIYVTMRLQLRERDGM